VKWYAEECESQDCSPPTNLPEQFSHIKNGDNLVDGAAALLQVRGPYPGDEYHFIPEKRFEVMLNPDEFFRKTYLVLDYMCNLQAMISHWDLENPEFDICQWYSSQLNALKIRLQMGDNLLPDKDDYFTILYKPLDDPELAYVVNELYKNSASIIQQCMIGENEPNSLELNGVHVPHNQLPAIECNAAVMQDATHVVPKPVVIVTQINGHNVQALIDSGSLGDLYLQCLQISCISDV
jgi:hypothetical protein